jgi:predicted DsbA family dithiol-disulfide isomerase
VTEQHALADPGAAVSAEFTGLATGEQIATAAAALDRNGIRPLLAATGADARRLVGSLLVAGAEVYNNTSQTLEAIGVAEDIERSGRYQPLRLRLYRMDREMQRREMRTLAAARAIGRVDRQLGGTVRFAFRHFPLTGIHPHALAAAAAAEAAAVQGRFWDMHELLFHRQKALEDGDLLRYAAQLGLDAAAFDRDRSGKAVLERIQRDVDSGLASGQVLGTPTLFIDGVVHRGGYDPPALLAALARWR